MARSRNRPLSGPSSNGIMRRIIGILFVLFLLVLVGGAAVLATWDIPAPSKTVEKVIADDLLPR